MISWEGKGREGRKRRKREEKGEGQLEKCFERMQVV